MWLRYSSFFWFWEFLVGCLEGSEGIHVYFLIDVSSIGTDLSLYGYRHYRVMVLELNGKYDFQAQNSLRQRVDQEQPVSTNIVIYFPYNSHHLQSLPVSLSLPSHPPWLLYMFPHHGIWQLFCSTSLSLWHECFLDQLWGF